MLNIKRTTSENIDFQKLVGLLDEVLRSRDGEDHDFYAQHNTLDKINHVVVFYQDDAAIGCGAFKELDSNTIEIKRMFVHPDHRGEGIASDSERTGNLGKRIQLYQLRSGNRQK